MVKQQGGRLWLNNKMADCGQATRWLTVAKQQDGRLWPSNMMADCRLVAFLKLAKDYQHRGINCQLFGASGHVTLQLDSLAK